MSASHGSRPRSRDDHARRARRRDHSPAAPAAVQPSRRVAYEVLRAVSESDAYANLLLPTLISRAGLSPADAALATELTYGTLRRRGYYDAVIAIAARRPVDEIDAPVRDALRLSTHQLLSTRVASHAAVNEGVELVRGAVGRGPTGFANAVLRAIAREDPGYWQTRVLTDVRGDDARKAVESAHPTWIVRALRRALAAEGRADELDALLSADNTAPAVTMVALPGLAEAPAKADRTPYSPLGFRAPQGDPDRLVSDSEGRVRVQDEGSQLAALALTRAQPVREGERWLDLCAGPGGKTAVLAAEALLHGASVTANEVVPARAGLVRRSVAGVPLDVPVREEDGREVHDDEGFDRVLVDAPCTGLGALRRRPEARWRKTPADVPELTALQEELIEAGLRVLKPGGILAYVTCSPHPAETAGIVDEALRRHADQIDELDARAVLQQIARSPLDLPEPDRGGGRAQLWPHRHGTDAMFISLFRKRPEATAGT